MQIYKNIFDKLHTLKQIINSQTDSGHSELYVDSKMGKFTEYELINCFSDEFDLNIKVDKIAEFYNKNKIKRGYFCLKFQNNEYSNDWFIVDEPKYKFYIIMTGEIELIVNDKITPFETGDCFVFDENEIINIISKNDEQYVLVTMISKLEHNKTYEA